MRTLRQTAFAARHPVDTMMARWHAIGTHTARLARLAQLGDARTAAEPDDLIGVLAAANDWQCELAWQSVEDITAMLHSGMAALDVLESRGIETRIPALALWREVDAAQRSLLAMLTATASNEAPSAATA
ncbi:MAG: hypothetical protein ACJLS3_05370 [Erythrobacter sp.]